MTTPPIVTITDELLADLQLDAEMADDMGMPAALVEPSVLAAMLAHIAELNKIISERTEPASQGTKSKRVNWLENIREAQKFGLPKLLIRRLDNTAKEIENSIRYGGTMRLRDRISELEAERADLKQQLVAAGITAENCELFRKDVQRYAWLREMHNDGYGALWVSRWNYEKTEWVSLDAFCRPDYDGELDLDAAIDAARSAGKDG